jgi:hypothetical protein
MRARSHLRVHDSACDPVLTRGPRAQETVWGQALCIESWGEYDPEWTAGDDVRGFTRGRASFATRLNLEKIGGPP